jgi:hypothetical protein
MKVFTQSLTSFITDFNLVRQDGIICFDSTIYFSSNSNFIQMPTEVQIISMENFELLYLLSPDIDRFFIPDMYTVGKEFFRYIKNTALIIKGHSIIQGKYTLSIHPEGVDCDAATLKEIHGRTYN